METKPKSQSLVEILKDIFSISKRLFLLKDKASNFSNVHFIYKKTQIQGRKKH